MVADLTRQLPKHVRSVGLTVDAPDDELTTIAKEARVDMLQLHGSEPPERVAAIRRRLALPVIKAIPIRDRADLCRAGVFEDVADWLLFDAPPPLNASRPGGNAQVFDWRILAERSWRRPWMLAGGLEAGNLAEAVAASGARHVDVSSGVETAPGIKSVEKIREFLRLAASL